MCVASFVQRLGESSALRASIKKKSCVLLHNMNMPLFIPSPVGGHLDCFEILAFVNKAALNIIVHIFGVYIHSFLLVIYL